MGTRGHRKSVRWLKGVAVTGLLATACLTVSAQGATPEDLVVARTALAVDLADDLFGYAELGYQERRSSARLSTELEQAGFAVERGVAGIPTAFVARYGSGSPVIAILAEFDALPGLSQAPTPERQPLVKNAPGHACGHHLFGAASVTAGLAFADWLTAGKHQGTVIVVGTPAEEGGSGKVYLTRAGVFDDTDVVLHWHPSDVNNASPYATNSNKSGRFSFHGIAAHAASAPDRGRSALDGVEAMNHMVNLMREHVPDDARIHYVITDGGDAPNIVPEYAEVYYYVRHPEAARVIKLFERVVDAGEGAALGTGTRMSFEVMHGNYPVLPNDTLAELVHAQMTRLGGIGYTAAENEFAKTIRKTFVGKGAELGSQASLRPFKFRQNMGSTDVGDVSWTVPTVGFTTATWVPGTPAHSWQAVASGGSSIGHKGMLLAAKTLVSTAVALVEDAALIEQAAEEFNERRGPEFKYEALLGDRDPPLDYRK